MSSPDGDAEFEPTAEMMVHDYDDEATMEEEENLSTDSAENELDNLQKESDMPLETLLAMYGYSSSNGTVDSGDNSQHDSCGGSSSEEEILHSRDLTLDKEEIARDIFRNDDGSDETSVDELMEQVQPSSTAHLLRDEYLDGDEDDEDYVPSGDEVWKKTIQIGSDYQAVIPDLLNEPASSLSVANPMDGRLLWEPGVLAEADVLAYLRDVRSCRFADSDGVHRIPDGVDARDDEQALYLLVQSSFNCAEALRRRKLQTMPTTDPLSLWSEEECQSFESGLRIHGKNFFNIHQNKLRTRAVGELVQFYYFWKKTERQEAFCKGKLEKRKYAVNPGVTDYTDRFIERMENDFTSPSVTECSCPVSLVNSTDNSASVSVNHTHLSPSKRSYMDSSSRPDLDKQIYSNESLIGFSNTNTATQVGN